MEGIIVPLHKRGDVDDVNNNRGTITLVSCMSKFFTHNLQFITIVIKVALIGFLILNIY